MEPGHESQFSDHSEGVADGLNPGNSRQIQMRRDEGTKRSLQERHLSMIALAGMIGTGLFLSSGKALAQAGPLGCLLGFGLMGTVTASIAYSSAEMSAFKPVEGGFVRHAVMWLDNSSGIAVGWNFWYSMAITMPAEISAAATLLQFWLPTLNPVIPISLLWVVVALVNFSPVRVYGEFEFYFAFCKIILIVFFILGGVLLDVGVLPGQEHIGFRYWRDPYPLFREYIFSGLKGRFLGFWSTMISAAFAYGNVQVVAIAGAETQNPRKAIPLALRRTFTRIVLFYVTSVFVIALTIPANDRRLDGSSDVTHSPFVLAFRNVGFKALPSLINVIVLSSAFSSGNSCTFLASRTLHGLALDGHAPSAFLKLNRYHVPYIAVCASAVWGAVAYASVSHGSYQAFVWLVSLVTTAGIVTWLVIGITYLRFFKALQAQHISRDSLPYKSPLQPHITYYGLVMNTLILLFSGWDAIMPRFNVSQFFSNYLNCFLFIVFYIVCKIWIRDSVIPLDAIDFRTELAKMEYEAIHVNDVDTKTSAYDRLLNRLF